MVETTLRKFLFKFSSVECIGVVESLCRDGGSKEKCRDDAGENHIMKDLQLEDAFINTSNEQDAVVLVTYLGKCE